MKINIVGAGPSGSYAALLLAKQGHEVNVFEEHPQIGIPVQCTGIVTGALWDLIPKEPSIILTELKKVKIHAPNQQSTELPLNEYVLNRADLDKYIAQLATKASVKYHLAHRFVKLTNQGILVRHKGVEKDIEGDITIGADGVNSEVAKQSGLWTPREVWGGVQATIEGNYDPNTFDVYFGKDYEGFFGWGSKHVRCLFRKRLRRIFWVGSSRIRN
jgi:flavin-dependent dehydrogenase